MAIGYLTGGEIFEYAEWMMKPDFPVYSLTNAIT